MHVLIHITSVVDANTDRVEISDILVVVEENTLHQMEVMIDKCLFNITSKHKIFQISAISDVGFLMYHCESSHNGISVPMYTISIYPFN